MPDEIIAEPDLMRPVRARGHRVWIAMLIAFVLGLGAAGWLGWRSGADYRLLLGLPTVARAPSMRQSAAVLPSNPVPDAAALSGRLAVVEQHLDRLNMQVQSASGHTARAEALLVAFAVRRVAERGAPLGYLADQLKLRFGDTQPNAVATIVIDARDLVPLDRLAARLEEIAPRLTAIGQQTLWHQVTGELAQLLVIRRDRPALSDAAARFADARLALSEGRIDEAIAIVQQLSNGSDAVGWALAARRYRDVERALDLIDTTALLDPHPLPGAVGA